MSQDPEFDSILEHSRSLQLEDRLAIDKYYDIYRYLKTIPEYKDKDYETTWEAVKRTQNWLTAYAKIGRASCRERV